MRDLARSLRFTGQPVPVPWPQVGRYLKPRTQSVLIVLAASGVGKSTVALDWALELAQDQPALYLSLDTALVDHAIRVIARQTGHTIREVEEGHDEDPKAWAQKWAPTLLEMESSTHLRFCDQNMRVETIGELVAAETEYWGDAPKLVIVDNLMNLLEGAESAAEYRRIVSELLRVAKEHHALVVGLHHLRKKPAKSVKDEEDDDDEGTRPVRLHDSLFAVDQEAKYVVGLWRPQPWDLKLSILKNRMGDANANGKVQVSLSVDMARARITERGAA